LSAILKLLSRDQGEVILPGTIEPDRLLRGTITFCHRMSFAFLTNSQCAASRETIHLRGINALFDQGWNYRGRLRRALRENPPRVARVSGGTGTTSSKL